MLKKRSELGSEQVRENINAYIELIEGKKYAYLFYAEDDSVIYTEEARRDAKTNENLFPKVCIAVMVKTLAHKLVANFYFKFHKPNYPFKVFDKTQDAEAWCYEQTEIAKHKVGAVA